VRARVENAAAMVASIAAREHRRRVRLQRETETVLVLGGVVAGASWLVMGGGALLVIADQLPEDVSLLTALTHESAARESPSAVWALFAWIAGFALSLSLVLVAYARARGTGAPPPGLPPLEGGAPRCRLCGAGLPGGSAVRTCASCGVRNLVDGRALGAQVRELLEALGHLEHAEAEELESAHGIVQRLAWLAPLLPLFGPLAGALVGALGVPWDPVALHVCWLLAAPALVAVLAMTFQSPVRVRRLLDTGPGDLVRIGGASYRVHAVMSDVPVTAQPRTLHVLGPEGAPQPQYAVWLQEYPDDAIVAYAVQPSGSPASPSDVARLATFPVRAVPGPGSDGRATGAIFADEQPVRVFAHPVAAGATPLWTLTRTSLKARRIFVP
jgi:hypothetical protein